MCYMIGIIVLVVCRKILLIWRSFFGKNINGAKRCIIPNTKILKKLRPLLNIGQV